MTPAPKVFATGGGAVGYDTRNIALAYAPVSHVFMAFYRTYDAGQYQRPFQRY